MSLTRKHESHKSDPEAANDSIAATLARLHLEIGCFGNGQIPDSILADLAKLAKAAGHSE